VGSALRQAAVVVAQEGSDYRAPRVAIADGLAWLYDGEELIAWMPERAYLELERMAR